MCCQHTYNIWLYGFEDSFFRRAGGGSQCQGKIVWTVEWSTSCKNPITTHSCPKCIFSFLLIWWHFRLSGNVTAQKLAHVEEAGQGEAEVDYLRNIAKRTTDPWVECFYTNTYSKLLTSSLSAVINSSNLLPSCENDVSKLLLSCRCCYCYIAKCFHQHHSQHQQHQ